MLGSLVFPTLFILPILVWPTNLPRDHPKTIWRRCSTTTATCLLFSWVPSYLALQSAAVAAANNSKGNAPAYVDLLPSLLGFRSSGLLAALTLPPLLVAILFSGPILMSYYDSTLKKPYFRSPIGVRNLIVGPLTEELSFRSGLISFFLLSGVSTSRTLWLSPLLFAVAHVHHMVDSIVHQGLHPADALAICLLQVGFTTIFGWFAAFLFLRTGHYAAVVVAHSLCNYLGFPDFSTILSDSHPKAAQLKIALFSGIVGFVVLLMPLTCSELYGFENGARYVDLYSTVVPLLLKSSSP